MKNRQFHFMLRKLTMPCGCALRGLVTTGAGTVRCSVCKDSGKLRVTVGRIAEAIYVSRPRLNEVLNNKEGRGALTRPKVIRFFDNHLPEHKAALLAALGWDASGNLLPVTGEVSSRRDALSNSESGHQPEAGK
jgi:hypothetical protein